MKSCLLTSLHDDQSYISLQGIRVSYLRLERGVFKKMILARRNNIEDDNFFGDEHEATIDSPPLF